jgi:SAM-dependent methyltransferase
VSLAQGFGASAVDYDRFRPDWPPAAVDRAVELLALPHGAEVVDLAAGTGKLTRLLSERFERVVAIEPDERMRGLLEVETYAGTAEEIPLHDASADAVFVADAFHWFDGPVALREIARVLRPRGGLVLLWNNWWETDPPLPDEAIELLREPYERSGRAAMVAAYDWRVAFEGSAFEPPREERVTGETRMSARDLVRSYRSGSSIAWLEEPEWEVLRAKLLGLLSGEYRVPLPIDIVWTRRAA